jgi:hypothetical protein
MLPTDRNVIESALVGQQQAALLRRDQRVRPPLMLLLLLLLCLTCWQLHSTRAVAQAHGM